MKTMDRLGSGFFYFSRQLSRAQGILFARSPSAPEGQPLVSLAIARCASPPWHRRLRQRRARARLLVRAARRKPAPTAKQLDKVFSSLKLLQGHHSAPRYKIPMSWHQNWNTWQKNPGKGGKSKSRSSKPAGGQNKEKAEFPSYDSMPGSSQPSPSTTSPVVGQAALLEILKKVAAKDEDVAKQVESLIPEEDTSLKDQQKQLNAIRKIKTKISKKEQSLVHKEDQMQGFMEKMRSHVQAEKERHKQETDEINKELLDLRKDLERVKTGQGIEKDELMELSLEAALQEGEQDLVEDNKRLHQELVKAKQTAEEASQMAYHMKAQFESVMARMAQFAPTGTSPVPSETLDGKGPVIPVEDLETKPHLIKNAMAPFGVIKSTKIPREGPYSPGSGQDMTKTDQRMDQMS